MSMNLQEISDRLEIQNLLIDYSSAIDSKQFDDLDHIFTPDAYIDYSCFGGPTGNYPEIKEFLKKAMPMFPKYYHMIGNSRVWLDGDTARARTICFNPMVMKGADDKKQTAFYGLWYVDKLLRTPDGWRLSERLEEPCFIHNLPPGFEPVES